MEFRDSLTAEPLGRIGVRTPTIEPMAMSADAQRRILEALSAKLPEWNACPICNVRDWELGDGFIIALVADYPMAEIAYAQRRLPSIGVICRNCGNTVIMNMYKLGLEDLLPPGVPPGLFKMS